MGSKAPSFPVQEPPTHACVAAHTFPHDPQLFGSVCVFAQPVVMQQVWPALHAGPPLQFVGFWHMPPVHTSPSAQMLPHEPQLFVSVCVLVQPFEQQDSPPVQTGPPLHVAVHMLLTQFPPGGHALPQPPQLFGSLVVSAQPVAQHCWLPVHAGPPAQPSMHMLFTQLEPGMLHTIWHPPQFFGSLVVSVHPVSQHVRFGGQEG
jgi:hypothetical protein